MAIAARVGCTIPKNTNLTHPEMPHLILGPFTTKTGNTTIYTCMVVTVDSTGAATVAASKAMPAGVVINQPDLNWGNTKPGNYILLPSLIDFYICAWGPCMVALDVSEMTDAVLPIGVPVYVSGGDAGLCQVEPALATGTAGEYAIGVNMDWNAGFTTLAAGADGDLCECFVDINMHVVSGT